CRFVFFFFFQAEDGIRDRNVTGVQTCALPICPVFMYRTFLCSEILPLTVSHMISRISAGLDSVIFSMCRNPSSRDASGSRLSKLPTDEELATIVSRERSVISSSPIVILISYGFIVISAWMPLYR